jgi:hypothetical protein
LGAIIAVAFILKKRMRRLFTWSNERAHLTLEKIDRVFFTNEWEAIHPHHYLHSMTMLCSDHAPLVFKTGDSYAGKKRLHFRLFWVRALGFREAVAYAWRCPLHEASTFRRLDWLFHNTARVLKSWSDMFVGNEHQRLKIAKEVVHQLEMAGDCHPLAQFEEALGQFFECKALGLASLQRTIAWQESRVLWLNEGDASMRFIHSYANSSYPLYGLQWSDDH